MATRVVLKNVRLSFPNLFKPEPIMGEGEPKYSTMVMIPKSDEAGIKALRDAEAEATEAGIAGTWSGKKPSTIASIIKDGDDAAEDFPERAGHWYMSINASEKFKPGVVDKQRNPVLDQSEVYSGVYAHVSVTGFPYKFGSKAGVSFGLNNVMVLGYGDSLAGGVSAEDEFADFAEDEGQESLI